jgi:hypothetical protein
LIISGNHTVNAGPAAIRVQKGVYDGLAGKALQSAAHSDIMKKNK